MSSRIQDYIKKQGGDQNLKGRFNEVELLFISEQLDMHGEYLTDLFVDSIESKSLRNTDQLIDSIEYKHEMRGNNPTLVFSFPSHGRLIEINFHKKLQSRSIAEAVDTDALLYNIRKRKQSKRKKKDTRWYTRNVYGSLNRLLARLASEYSDAEIARLISIIEHSGKQGFSGVTTYI